MSIEVSGVNTKTSDEYFESDERRKRARERGLGSYQILQLLDVLEQQELFHCEDNVCQLIAPRTELAAYLGIKTRQAMLGRLNRLAKYRVLVNREPIEIDRNRLIELWDKIQTPTPVHVQEKQHDKNRTPKHWDWGEQASEPRTIDSRQHYHVDGNEENSQSALFSSSPLESSLRQVSSVTTISSDNDRKTAVLPRATSPEYSVSIQPVVPQILQEVQTPQKTENSEAPIETDAIVSSPYTKTPTPTDDITDEDSGGCVVCGCSCEEKSSHNLSMIYNEIHRVERLGEQIHQIIKRLRASTFDNSASTFDNSASTFDNSASTFDNSASTFDNSASTFDNFSMNDSYDHSYDMNELYLKNHSYHDYQTFTRDYQTFTRDYQTFTRDYQTFTRNYQTFTRDYQTFTRNYQTFTRDYQTFTQKKEQIQFENNERGVFHIENTDNYIEVPVEFLVDLPDSKDSNDTGKEIDEDNSDTKEIKQEHERQQDNQYDKRQNKTNTETKKPFFQQRLLPEMRNFDQPTCSVSRGSFETMIDEWVREWPMEIAVKAPDPDVELLYPVCNRYPLSWIQRALKIITQDLHRTGKARSPGSILYSAAYNGWLRYFPEEAPLLCELCGEVLISSFSTTKKCTKCVGQRRTKTQREEVRKKVEQVEQEEKVENKRNQTLKDIWSLNGEFKKRYGLTVPRIAMIVKQHPRPDLINADLEQAARIISQDPHLEYAPGSPICFECKQTK